MFRKTSSLALILIAFVGCIQANANLNQECQLIDSKPEPTVITAPDYLGIVLVKFGGYIKFTGGKGNYSKDSYLPIELQYVDPEIISDGANPKTNCAVVKLEFQMIDETRVISLEAFSVQLFEPIGGMYKFSGSDQYGMEGHHYKCDQQFPLFAKAQQKGNGPQVAVITMNYLEFEFGGNSTTHKAFEFNTPVDSICF